MSLRAAGTRLPAVWALALLLCFAAPACGALPIDIEVAMAPGVPITAPQEWAKLLGKIGLARVQLRSARPSDQPQITATESRIQVLAILNRKNELILPDRRFKSYHLTALRKYFEDLPGKLAEGDEPRGRFDLTDKQFRVVYDDFSKRVNFSMTRAELLRRFAKKFAAPIEFDPVAKIRLSNSPLTRELRDMTAGTSLALVLRQEGLALKPEKPRGEPLRIRV
ncbi:MAG: hypothetical protein GXP28_08885, partial [Planctomycetes bacterium]|nr:hypothetical protein [Planctomycetota bacterium]